MVKGPQQLPLKSRLEVRKGQSVCVCVCVIETDVPAVMPVKLIDTGIEKLKVKDVQGRG